MRTVRLSREQSFTGPLVLVNRQHPLQAAAGEDLTAVDGRRPDILLDRQAARLYPEGPGRGGDRPRLRLAEPGGTAADLG